MQKSRRREPERIYLKYSQPEISKKPKGKSVKSKSDDEESSETESPKAEIKAEDTKEEKSDRIDDADIDIMVE